MTLTVEMLLFICKVSLISLGQLLKYMSAIKIQMHKETNRKEIMNNVNDQICTSFQVSRHKTSLYILTEALH